VKLIANWDEQAQVWAMEDLPPEDHYCEGDCLGLLIDISADFPGSKDPILNDDGNIDFKWVDSSSIVYNNPES
jgi:hypothetical protein